MTPLATDTRLAEVIAEAERTPWAAQIMDTQWRLVWVSDALKALLGTSDEDELGYGAHMLEVYGRVLWSRTVTRETQRRNVLRDVPMMIEGTPGGKDAMREMLTPETAAVLDDIEPLPIPPVWVSEVEFIQGDLPPTGAYALNLQLRADDEPLGVLRVYGSSLPANLLALVGRGDEAMFERMARVFEPGRRKAAVLFADLQASGSLSRRLSSSAYFRLIRDLTTSIDNVVITHGGIVGKHAGDGVTAFFLVDDAGSESGAVRAAVEAGRAIADVARSALDDYSDVEPDACLFNVGMHWGGTLYMGQVVTGGRIEVTALGDEVNETARIQQAARDGQAFASKDLLERLSDEDAAALEIDLDATSYQALAELPGVSEKAVRDAGAIAVVDVCRR